MAPGEAQKGKRRRPGKEKAGKERTDGDGGLEDLESDLSPLSDRLEVDSSVDEGLSEISTTGSEGVCSDGDGSGGLVGVEEGDGLGGKNAAVSLRNSSKVRGGH